VGTAFLSRGAAETDSGKSTSSGMFIICITEDEMGEASRKRKRTEKCMKHFDTKA
jgi:hypothetical protein